MWKHFCFLLSAFLFWFAAFGEFAEATVFCCDFNQNLDQISTTSVTFDITTITGSDASRQLFRGSTLAITGSPLVAGAQITDTNYQQNTNTNTGLTPGTEYSYTLKTDKDDDATVGMCTKVANPQGVQARAKSSSEIIVEFYTNPSNGAAVGAFEFVITPPEAGATYSPTVATLTADSTTVTIAALAPFTSYTIGVTQLSACTANTDSFKSDAVTSSDVITGPAQPSLAVATLISPEATTSLKTSTTLKLTLTGYSQGSGVTHTVYRKSTTEFIVAQTLTGNLETAATTPHIFYDSGLTPGTEYTYKVVTSSGGLTAETAAEVKGCTAPEKVTDLSYASTTTTKLTLSWAKPTGGVSAYTINVDGTASTPVTALTADVSANAVFNKKFVARVGSAFTCPSTPDNMIPSDGTTEVSGYTAPNKPADPTVAALSDLQDGITKIQLTWTAPSAPAVETADQGDFKWDIFRGLGTNPTTFETVLEDGAFSPQFFIDTNLAPATLYTYKIRGFFGDSGSDDSDAVVGCTYPTPPEDVIMTTLSSTEIKCSWTKPSGNGDLLDKYSVRVNSQTEAQAKVVDTLFVVLDSAAGDYSTFVNKDGVNTCSVKAIISTGCPDVMKSAAADARGYFAPLKPTTAAETLSSTTIQVTVTPLFTDLTPNTVGMSATLYRDDEAIAFDDSSPFIFDDTNLEPGKQYTYKSTVTANGNPSDVSDPISKCTSADVPHDVRQIAQTDVQISVTFSAPKGNWEEFILSKDGTDGPTAPKGGDTTEYTYHFTSLTADSCYVLGVKTKGECASTPTVQHAESEVITIRACTAPAKPVITAVAESVGSIELAVTGVTSGDYNYYFWRGATGAVNLQLDTSAVNDGTLTDSFQLTAGGLYCYQGAVEKKANGKLSAKSDEVCLCALPSPVKNLAVQSRTFENFVYEWTLPEGSFEKIEVTVDVAGTDKVTEAPPTGITLNTDSNAVITGMLENTAYAVTVRTLKECIAPPATTETPVYSPPVSLSAFTLSKNPILTAETSIDDPTTITINFFLADGTTPASGFGYILKRGGVKIQGDIENPHVDSGLEPASIYEYVGYLVGEAGIASAASPTIKFGTHPKSPLNPRQTASTTTSATVKWDSPENGVDGYYLDIGEIVESVATGVDSTATAARVTEFAKALAGVTEKTDAVTSVVDGGSTALEPASDYVIGVTACKDHIGLTDFSDTATPVDSEMCSPYTTLTIHTKPADPTCTIETESSTELQLTIAQASTDGQIGTFSVQRDDLGYEYLTGLDPANSPYSDQSLIPAKKYTYSVTTVYEGQVSAAVTCSACTQPAQPINFSGSFVSDTSIKVTWDVPQGEAGVPRFWVKLATGNAVQVSYGEYSHTFRSGIVGSTCYEISIYAKYTCEYSGPPPPTQSDEVIIEVCSQPAVCAINSVSPPDVATTDYQFNIEVELTTIADHTYNIYRDGELVLENLASTSTTNVDNVGVAGSYHCYKCTATKNGIESKLSTAVEKCTCTRPGPPVELNFKPTATTIDVTWAAPLLNKAYTDFDFQGPDGSTVNDVTTFSKRTESLDESTEYVFQLRTTYTCPIPSAATPMESDWASITAYTAPAVPTLSVQDQTASTIKLAVADSAKYTRIRLFKNNVELFKTDGSAIAVADWADGYIVGAAPNPLVAGTLYTFTVIVFNAQGFYAESAPVKWCTNPMPVRSLETSPRYFYGFLVEFEEPESGKFDSYEVDSELDLNWPHSTVDANGVNQLYYYYYNWDIAKDYKRKLNHIDWNFEDYFGKDLAYKVGKHDSDLESSTTYTVNVRSKKTCSVNDVSTDAAADVEFDSEIVSGNAFTGAHPVIDIETVPLSQTSIQVSFAPFEEQADFTYKIYRYKNQETTPEYESPALTIDQIPFEDGVDDSSINTPLVAATLYRYEIGVIYKTQETFGKDRLQLESEYWPGNYNDPISNEYATDLNREGRWRLVQSDYDDYEYDPTFKNDNDDASGQHNIFHFYYKEKIACTFPPSPTSVTEDLDTHTSTIMNWEIASYSDVSTMQYAGHAMNVSTFLYINGKLINQLKDVSDYDTRTYKFESLDAKTAYTCELDIGLTCPDDLTHFDYFDYFYAPTEKNSAGVWEKGTIKPTTFYKTSNTLFASDSTSTLGRKSVKCWTRPTPPQITSVEPGDTDVAAETTQLLIQYTTDDTGVKFEVDVTQEMSPTHPVAADWTTPAEETSTLNNFGGLKPGSTFNVRVRSFWEDSVPGSATPKRMESLWSPADLGTVNFGGSEPAPLTTNGQNVYTDPILVCTAPLPPAEITVIGVSASEVEYTVKNPGGVLAGYQYEYTYTGAPAPTTSIAFVEPTPFAYLVKDEFVTGQINDLPSCTEITVDAKSVTSCELITGGTLLSPTAASASGFTKPLSPSFTPDSCVADSNAAVTLVFEHTNPTTGCTVTAYKLYRDGGSTEVQSGTTETIQDTGLTAGTTYQYQVTMTANGEESLKSESLTICTKPNPPTNPVRRERTDGRSLAIQWTPPAEGQATGYLVTDNLLGGHTNQRTKIDSITYPMGLDYGTEYTIDISVRSFLTCEVTEAYPIRDLISDDALVETVVIGTAPTLPVVLHALTAKKNLSLAVSFWAGKIDRVQLKLNEPLDDPPTSDQGTFVALDPTKNMEFEFTVSDPSVVAPTVYFNFTNLKIDTRYWFTVIGIFDGSQRSSAKGPKNQIMYMYVTPPPDDTIMGLTKPIFAVVITAVAVVGAFLVAGVVFLLIKGGPVAVAKMSAIVSPAQPAAGPQGPSVAEVEQPVPRDNRANQLKFQHTERQLNKELLANRILAE